MPTLPPETHATESLVDIQEQVSRRALELYEQRGREDGHDRSSNSGNGWLAVNKLQPKLQTQQEMRSKGAQRTQNFNSMRSYRGDRMGGGRRR